jgi:hypothetical protein
MLDENMNTINQSTDILNVADNLLEKQMLIKLNE